MKLELPIVDESSSLRSDGSRNYVHPADVRGRYTRLRRLLFPLLIALYAALPWIEVGGHPAIFLDVPARRFYLLGAVFNAQDFWLVFFLLSGIGFSLILLTTLLGRVWCGYACPQTVFLEGVFRRIERLIEGPRSARLRLRNAPLSWSKIGRRVLKHSLFIASAALIAHLFLSYFVSLPSLWTMMQGSPVQHPAAFAWVSVMTAVMYFNFAWFREQLCLILCPYGRLQSALLDEDTRVIGYDRRRGEPRGREAGKGDCIDCRRCIVVCPTGIDIRQGLQIDCIGCAACVDACDEVMTKIGKPQGLVRYDSLRGLQGGKRRFWRPRLALYGLLGLIGFVVATTAFRSRRPFEANLLRASTAPYVVEAGRVRNSMVLHLINKYPETQTFRIEGKVPGVPGAESLLAQQRISLGPLQSQQIPWIVRVPSAKALQVSSLELVIVPEGRERDEVQRVHAPFLAPGS